MNPARCPKCGNDNMSKMMGVEHPEVYDGILFWVCEAFPCNNAWPRWAIEDHTRRGTEAQRHADIHNRDARMGGRDPSGGTPSVSQDSGRRL